MTKTAEFTNIVDPGDAVHFFIRLYTICRLVFNSQYDIAG